MGLLNILGDNKILFIIDFSLILIIGIIHFAFYFYIKETDFGNIYDSLESSPLFDFEISDNCGANSHITFHKWEGRKEIEYYYRKGRRRSRTKIVDATNIIKINGKLFCYRHVPYKELLYNDQIRKENEQYNGEYTKDCGIIDTLNQHLYIKQDEKCPIYDVGIGNKANSYDYIYLGDKYRLYFNNVSYIDPKKKIIGKLFLNDGQPCYQIKEKLWRKFDSVEAGEEHLKCNLEIFGKYNDERYENKGDITYDKIYFDNLSVDNYDRLKEKLNDDKVSLYSREFLGIDKECDKKNNIEKDTFEKLKKNQNMEKTCLLVESIIIFSFHLVLIITLISILCKSSGTGNDICFELIFLILFLSLFFVCLICQAVFLGRITNNDLSYDCSDDITNEILRKENENTKKSISYTKVNLGLDIAIILLNIITPFIIVIWDICNNKIIPNRRRRFIAREKNFNSVKKKTDGISKEPSKEESSAAAVSLTSVFISA